MICNLLSKIKLVYMQTLHSKIIILKILHSYKYVFFLLLLIFYSHFNIVDVLSNLNLNLNKILLEIKVEWLKSMIVF